MADILWHKTDGPAPGWPDAPCSRKGIPGEKESQSYPAPGFTAL